MPIEFFCQTCHSKLRTPDDTAGKMVRCPKCGQLDRIPSEPSVADEAPRVGDAAFTSPTTPPQLKPSAGSGQDSAFRPEATPSTNWQAPGSPSNASSHNPYATPVIDVNRPLYRYQPSPESIAARLIPPGIAQIVVSSTILLFGFLGLIGILFQFIEDGLRDEDIPTLIFIVVGGLLALTSLLGGIAMIRRRGYSFALAGSISTIVVGIFCCFFPVPVGVWALVVLLSDQTRSAFR